MVNLEDKKYHFIAIGGVGMSGLAKYMKERGNCVSGSDIQESKYTHLLESLGVKVHIGHNADLIEKDMIIIASSAIKNDNPEIIKAKELNLDILHRSDILKLISDEFSNKKDSTFIGFSGTHGKTTTSGLCSYILEKANYKPSFVVGGIIPDINTNAKYDGDKYFIAELDESDGTIQKYSTDIAVINNMEEDHLDHYKNGFNDIAETFNMYLSNKKDQKVIINIDNDGNKRFMSLYPEYNYITYGLEKGDYYAQNIKYDGLTSKFNLYKKGEDLGEFSLSVLGRHNVYNAVAVISALIEAGIDINEIRQHIKTFSGMGRRFEEKAEFSSIKVYDDYAHHPSEIKTTLNGIKTAVNGKKRVVAIFQPHRFTRLKSLWNEFKYAFRDSDLLLITDVYPAGEAPIEGITSENFSKEVEHGNHKYIKGSIEEAANEIYPLLKEGDIVITLGAGDITNMGKYLALNSEIKV